MNFMALMEELREAIKKDERTHASIAKEAEIHPKTFSAFVHGRRGLSIETIEKLTKALRFEIRLVRIRG